MQDFEIIAMPKVVPSELTALPCDELVLVKSNICGVECEGQTTAGELREELESIIGRQNDGFLTVSEAAQLWADATGANPKEQRKKLWREIERGTIKAFDDADKFETFYFPKNKFSCLLRIDDLKALGVNLPFMMASFTSDATPNKPAPVSAAPEHEAGPEPVQAAPAMKRRALIAEYLNEWPSIEADLNDASRNELDSAKLPKHGMWDADKALAWARSRGKLVQQRTSMEPATWHGAITRHQLR